MIAKFLGFLDNLYFNMWHAQENYGSDDDRFWLPYRAWQAVLTLQHMTRRER